GTPLQQLPVRLLALRQRSRRRELLEAVGRVAAVRVVPAAPELAPLGRLLHELAGIRLLRAGDAHRDAAAEITGTFLAVHAVHVRTVRPALLDQRAAVFRALEVRLGRRCDEHRIAVWPHRQGVRALGITRTGEEL